MVPSVLYNLIWGSHPSSLTVIVQSLSPTNVSALQDELFVAQRERKQALAQYEAQLHEAYMARQALEVANEAVSKLKIENKGLATKIDSLNLELKEASLEARDAMRLVLAVALLMDGC